MDIQWIIDPVDVQRVTEFVADHIADPFVRLRIRRNLAENKPAITRDEFWQAMVSALLTTQQRSGPGSPIKSFLDRRPFPLSYSVCISQHDLRAFVSATLSRAGGIRRFYRIADEVATNLNVLEGQDWERVLQACNALRENSTPLSEREAAHFIDDALRGFGPKQSRNLLQWLGLTRYEIPIDTRITRWLNEFGFPLRLSASALSDRHYYDFVSDGVQQLCSAASLFPCILDAAIFTTFDQGMWTEENIRSEDVFGA